MISGDYNTFVRSRGDVKRQFLKPVKIAMPRLASVPGKSSRISPTYFRSLLFALYGSCSFMFLETNIVHYLVPYFLRRSYFCPLSVSRRSRDMHIRCRIVLETTSRVNHNCVFVISAKNVISQICSSDTLFIHCQFIILDDKRTECCNTL